LPRDLDSALRELDQLDEEHPDCWLSDEAGWTVSVFGSGLVILENLESGEGPWHMRGVTRAGTRDLWLLLMAGDLASLRSRPWKDGYGEA